jgi:DNA-binding HxlR family transcriptional regulator
LIETHYDCPCMDTCPLNKSMELIGGKWKMQILCTLNSSGPVRYNALRRKMDGVSNTVLIRALRELEDSGLIKRTEYSEVPARVEYETTELCDSLIPILDSLSEWWEVHYASSVKTNDEEEKVKQEARR